MEAAPLLPGMDLTFVIGFMLQALFAMLRIGAFVIAAPIFAARFVPLPVRIVIAVALTVPVVATVPMPEPETMADLSVVPMVLSEIAIGVSAGLVLQILFAAAMVAGDWIAATAGLGFAAQMDPNTGTQTPVVAQLLFLLMLGLFVAEDGHLAAIRLLVESYETLPPGGPIHVMALVDAGLTAGRNMYDFAAQVMMPVVSILLIVNVVIGVITRSAPTMNIFSFGFPLTLSVTILLLFLTAPSLGTALASKIPDALNLLTIMIEALGNG